jgi:hypothetical protein
MLEDDNDLFASTVEEKDVQVQSAIDDTIINLNNNPSTIADVKQSVISNMDNTQLLNTNTYSIATTLLQEKVDRLEKEKAELLNSRNLENDPQFRNRFNNKNDVNHINNVH